MTTSGFWDSHSVVVTVIVCHDAGLYFGIGEGLDYCPGCGAGVPDKVVAP